MLVIDVLHEGSSLAEAARRHGVSLPTARLWVGRVRQDGWPALGGRSRRPLSSPTELGAEAVGLLLAEKALYPCWGAKKLMARLWPDGGAPFSLRSANRILSRNGLMCPPEPPRPAKNRFEREHPNELWQMDFKGLANPRLGYEAFSVIDDATRFCLALSPLPDQSFESVWAALWGIFGEFGMPECLLSDNGPAFRASAGRLPSALQVRLMRLGVRSAHGRPRHPQTQGKVERFHGTLERELGPGLRQPTAEMAGRVYAAFRERYNQERPHEAVALRPPGLLYSPSPRRRPPRLPVHELAPGALSRKTDDWGNFGHLGKRYKLGRGIGGERVELRRLENDDFQVLYFGNVLGRLQDFEV